MPNSTHRKRLARALSARAGISYMSALQAVTDAAHAGRLPSRLDDAGMQAALRVLTSGGSVTPAGISAQIAAATGVPATPLNRVYAKKASDPKDQPICDASARYEHLTGKQGLVYISAPGGKNESDRYAFGGGHVALGRNEALNHINNLLTEALLGATERHPYVGDGADGARRSAQIDREEADGLDADDPRMAEVLDSAHRWERQAALLEAATTPIEVTDGCQHPTHEYRAQEGDVCLDCNKILTAYPEFVAADAFHLEPAYLRLLRQVWQGRVTRTVRSSKSLRYAVDDQPVSDIKDIELRWLADNAYISAPLASGEEWVVARTTGFGDDVLAFHLADTDKFTDGLPAGSTASSTASAPATQGAKTLTHADIRRCPVRSLSASHYNDDGSCQCPPAERAPDSVGVADAFPENPYQSFDVSSTVQADVRGLLKVHQAFLDAGRVEWSWHRGDFKGEHGFKNVDGVNDAGELILRDENPRAVAPTSTLSLDYIDDPDKATRHLIWPNHSGVTFRDKDTGEIDATYRVAGPAPESPTGPKPVRRVVRHSTTFDPAVDRRMGGPTVTKVYNNREHRVTATCDVCNRRLQPNEQWWMVRSPSRGWENDLGVSCSSHFPEALPLYVNPTGRLTKDEKAMLDLLNKREGRLLVAGIPESRTALSLVDRGRIQVESGNLSTEGGSATIVAASNSQDPGADDVEEERIPSSVSFAHEGNRVARCDASSWRGANSKRKGEYGPGGFNRCVRKARHESERHIDEWGTVFELDPKFRVIKNITAGAVARIAVKDGIVVFNGDGDPISEDRLNEIFPYQATDPDDLNEEVRARLRPNLLVQTRGNEVLKVSTMEEQGVTAQVVYPLPPRTTVRRFSYVEAATWREPSQVMLNRYEEAWGFTD